MRCCLVVQCVAARWRDSTAEKPRRLQASVTWGRLANRRRPWLPIMCGPQWKGELWAPTQVPQDVRDSVATAIELDPDQVKVNVTLMGGGFGRRLEHDYAVEAALVSKAINAPVKVLWTREDDMRCSTYRPASYHKMSAALDGQGWPAAFSHVIVAASINAQKGTLLEGGVDPDL